MLSLPDDGFSKSSKASSSTSSLAAAAIVSRLFDFDDEKLFSS